MKLVKFNLIVDGQKCRTIAEIKENFNLIDILEHFKSKKLEKWFKARKLDELDALEKMKELADFELMQRLCELFEIDVEESHIRDELIVYQHSLLPKKERDREILELRKRIKELEKPKKPKIKVIQNNLVVKDKKSTLIWQKNVDKKKFTWDDAMEYAKKLNSENYVGYDDWRVPTIEELKTLIDTDIEALKSDEWFWSATAENASQAWLVSFSNGNDLYSYKSVKKSVRCVRERQ